MNDYHVHTNFSDGIASPEEMAARALRLGMGELGFSDHAPAPEGLENNWCMKRSELPRYLREIHRIGEAYRGRLRVLCGLEQDLESPPPPEGLDYLIGSVHYLHPRGHWFTVDGSPELLKNAVANWYGGDWFMLCEDYYAQVERLADIPCDIIGHFDLITKFNECGALFDEDHPRYRAAREKAMRVLLKTGRIFEINTGAISRGCRCTPYPRGAVMECIRGAGGRLLLTSDSHRPESLCYGFGLWKGWANTDSLGK